MSSDPSGERVVSFDSVVGLYDRGRPRYPRAIFDALEPLAGTRIVEGGAGTGIATRQLTARGANVVAVDVGPAVVRLDWFDAYWRTVEQACPGTHRSQRDTDWGRAGCRVAALRSADSPHLRVG